MGRNGIFFRLSRSARIEICLRTGNTVSHVFLIFLLFCFLFILLSNRNASSLLPFRAAAHRAGSAPPCRHWQAPQNSRPFSAMQTHPGKRCKTEENTVNHSEAILFHQPEKRLLPWYAQPAIVANARTAESRPRQHSLPPVPNTLSKA